MQKCDCICIDGSSAASMKILAFATKSQFLIKVVISAVPSFLCMLGIDTSEPGHGLDLSMTVPYFVCISGIPFLPM
jgi:hypothetical protein